MFAPCDEGKELAQLWSVKPFSRRQLWLPCQRISITWISHLYAAVSSLLNRTE